ncbi:hypothetical protein [Acinetobacter seifertii]|uniref:hypothetical protein n=1 Tax=Acinetobacter seifertii TaxID=1530123 RepID=UPI000668C449|nr:hypothetical protein [Acinetobacter seifertii]
MDKCKHGFNSACLICGFSQIEGNKVWFDWAFQHQQAKVEELQKRVDAATKQAQNALQYVEEDMRGNHEFLQMAMIRTFKDLEQALKGEGQ